MLENYIEEYLQNKNKLRKITPDKFNNVTIKNKSNTSLDMTFNNSNVDEEKIDDNNILNDNTNIGINKGKKYNFKLNLQKVVNTNKESSNSKSLLEEYNNLNNINQINNKPKLKKNESPLRSVNKINNSTSSINSKNNSFIDDKATTSTIMKEKINKITIDKPDRSKSPNNTNITNLTEYNQLKTNNRIQNDKIKELTNQLNTILSSNDELKLKYDKTLKSNIDLKKLIDKLQVQCNESKRHNNSKQLEVQLNDKIVEYDELREKFDYIHREYKYIQNEYNDLMIKNKDLQDENYKCIHIIENLNNKLK